MGVGIGSVENRSEGIANELSVQRLSFGLLKSFSTIEEIVFLARRAHEESRFSYIKFAPEKVRAIAESALQATDRHGVFMAWSDGAPVGFAYCSLGEYHIGIGTLVTTIRNICVLPEERHRLGGGKVAIGLFKGVESWSRARGSKEILIHVTSDVDLGRTDKFVQRLGYRCIGGSYAKSIS